MSGKVVGWAFDQGRRRELSPTHRYVLVAYADNASEKDGKCWPDKDEIVEKTGYSQATIYRAIKELETQGLLSFDEDEKGRPCVYLAVPWNSQSEKGDSQGENENSQSEKGTNKGTVSEPSHKKKVAGKVVSSAEYELATSVVANFNHAAGTKLGVDPHLTPIVMRVREHPAYTVEHHRRIIAAVFAGNHWWDDPAGVEIIYGNSGQFDKSIEMARRKQASSDNFSAFLEKPVNA